MASYVVFFFLNHPVNVHITTWSESQLMQWVIPNVTTHTYTHIDTLYAIESALHIEICYEVITIKGVTWAIFYLNDKQIQTMFTINMHYKFHVNNILSSIPRHNCEKKLLKAHISDTCKQTIKLMHCDTVTLWH